MQAETLKKASTVDRTAAPDDTSRHRVRARWWLVLAALVAAWVIPVAAFAADVTWLLPPLVLVVTASLLRGGRTLLDRVMLAVVLLLGATCAAGLLFSTWPWGLHPVPVSGLALTVLVAAALLARRRPALPRPTATDVLSLGAALLSIGYLASPYLRASGLTQRLSVMWFGEDNARHMALFDVIGRLGKYLFLDEVTAREHMLAGLIYYPQGWHLSAALLDGFARTPSGGPGGMAAFDHYLFWMLAGYGLLLLSLQWGAQWVAGRLHPVQRLVLAALVAALSLGTQLARLLAAGYATETLGLALTVVLAALAIRPVARVREQTVLVGALLIGVGLTYYFFAFPAGALALWWLIRDRRRLGADRSRLVTLVVTGAATLALAPLMLVLGLLLAGHRDVIASTVGPTPTEAYTTLLGLGALVGLGLLARSGPREVVWRRCLVACGIAVGFALALAALNVAMGGAPGYYFGKTAHLATAVLIIGAAGLARLLPTPAERAGEPTRRMVTSARPAAVAILAILAVFTASGVIGWTGGFFHTSGRNATWAAGWVGQNAGSQARYAGATVAAYRQYPPVPGTVTLVMDKSPGAGYLESLYLSTLQGTTSQTGRAIYGMPYREPVRTREILARIPGPVRLIVADPAADRVIEQVFAEQPELRSRVTVVRLAATS